MTDKIVVLVTAGSMREANKIARHLVEARLAACVNIAPPVQSVYRWRNKMEEAKEYLLIVKSTRDLFGEIKAEISKAHSYETPEVICLPIVDGSPEYLQWVGDSVKQASKAE